LIILPMASSSKSRDIPINITVDDTLHKFLHQSASGKIKFLIKALLSKLFYKELTNVNLFNLKVVISFLRAMIFYEKFYNFFDNYLAKQDNLEDTVLYTYWNTECTYALQSLKLKYNYKLISRIHGFDIYKERRLKSYMPLKKYFINNIDTIYTITENANGYLHDAYGFKYSILALSRLGVENLNIISKVSEVNSLHIVSCAFLSKVKRVDKLIDALCLLLDNNNNIYYTWTHIGDGVLFENLIKYAKEKLSKYTNLNYNFAGNLDNQEIYRFYKNNTVDVFINTSESEGVPVSIMEAMSCHIPIIAPNVGGISDMVIDKQNGVLLSESCNINEIVEAISKNDFFKLDAVRNKSYEVFLDKYDADKNYVNFIKEITK
jgi:glycosyltransferase involved in cell wall biosynthesis